jgi:hypothetical protein
MYHKRTNNNLHHEAYLVRKILWERDAESNDFPLVD